MIETKTVGEVVVEMPGATRLFERLGIDYCCGGGRLLGAACDAAGVNLNEVLQNLETIGQGEATAEKNWNHETLANLIAYIVEKHHAFTRGELQRIEKLLAKVCTVHAHNHPELWQINSLFAELKQDLLPHMQKEEQVLFPYIQALEEALAGNGVAPTPFFGTVKNPVRMMSLEHDQAGDLLKAIRQASNHFSLPEGVCISYKTLYQALEEFEQDLHRHIHLENNILFPRAVEVESLA